MIEYIPIHTIPAMKEQFDSVWELYYVERIIVCPDITPTLRPPKQRVCRFCKKQFPEVKFKKTAHAIPHLLGNKTLLSDFECDSCNQRFGALENDLAYFLGMSRTIWQTKGKNGIPNFHSPNDLITAKLKNLFDAGEGIEIRKKNVDDSSLIVNNDDGITTINYTKNPYRPFNVFQTLLKIALSCIDEKDVEKYSRTFQMLTNPHLSHWLKSSASIMKTSLSFCYVKDNPQVLILKKRNSDLSVPTHCMVLYFQNMLFQICLPYYEDDMKFNGHKIEMHYFPPISMNPFISDNNYLYQIIDMSSSDIKKDDEECYSMRIDLNSVAGLSKFDPKTGEFANVERDELNTAKIQSILLVPKDFTIPIDKMKKQ